MLKNIINKLIHVINIILVVITLVLTIIAIFKKEWIETFIEWMKLIIEGLGSWNFLIAFISSCIESFPVIGVVVPGQNILLIVGGFFGAVSSSNVLILIIMASLGAILGNTIGYILGKYSGDEFFRKYGNWFGIGLTEVRYLKKGINTWGPIGIILGKFHPITRAFLPYIAGGMGMKSTKFMIYNVIGSIIWAIAMVGLGVIFVENYKIILEYFGRIIMVIIIIIGIYIYKFKREKFMEYWNEKQREMDELYDNKNK